MKYRPRNTPCASWRQLIVFRQARLSCDRLLSMLIYSSCLIRERPTLPKISQCNSLQCLHFLDEQSCTHLDKTINAEQAFFLPLAGQTHGCYAMLSITEHYAGSHKVTLAPLCTCASVLIPSEATGAALAQSLSDPRQCI